MGQELPASRPQRHQPPSVPQQGHPEPVFSQLLVHVPVIDEPQLEQAQRPLAADRERTRVKVPHGASPNVEDDDDADPQPYAHVLHAERPRRQKRHRRVIAWCGPPRRQRDDMESRLRAGREPEPPRA
jgi:hypothetical protein